MAVNYRDAVAQLTAKDAPFELTGARVGGIDMRVYRNAPVTLRDVFENGTSAQGVALVYQEERFGFSDLRSATLALASAMAAHGIGKGDRVAIAMRNLPEYVMAFWATQRIGAVLVGINAWWVGGELAFALSDSQPKLLLVDGERLDRLDSETRRMMPYIVVTRNTATPVRDNPQRWEDFVACGIAPPPVPPLSPDDPATMLYTSGTTGKPKAAISTHLNHTTNLMNLIFAGAVSQLTQSVHAGTAAANIARAALLPFPMFHIGGISGVYVNMAIGAKLVLMRKWDAGEAARLIEMERISSIALAPSMLRQLIDKALFDQIDRSSLTSFATGSAPVPIELAAEARLRFGPGAMPMVGYGLTEATSGVCANAGADLENKPGSVGPVFPVLDVRIVDPTGLCDVVAGSPGEVWLRGPNMVGGYWNRPDANAESFVAGGWFRTGDIGRQDEDGFLFIVDRLKDMIIRGGENIYCVEVEEALLAHPGVYDVAVVGVPDEDLGESVSAVVVPVGDIKATEAELIRFAREHLAYFEVPSRVVLRAGELPRTPAGKVDKKVLRAELAGAAISGVATLTAHS